MIPGTQMYLKVKGVFFLQVDTDRKAVTKLKNLYSYLCKSFSVTFDLCDYSHHTCSSLNPTSFEISEILENEGGERKREKEKSHDAKGTIVCECSRFYAREIADHDGN